MMGGTLVVMAAGMGSRYGSLKQIDRLGPSGELLVEYSIFDAMVAGFNKVVFVVHPDMEASLRELCGNRISRYMDVAYAVQSNNLLPGVYSVPEGREKPFGTVHALLSARQFVSGPFAIINADDFYGFEAFQLMYDAICELPEDGEACMPGYWLKNTLSPHGSVSRGLCDVKHKHLIRIREERSLTLFPDGTIRNIHGKGPLTSLSFAPNSLVSMNFWGFMPSIFDYAEQYFYNFLASLSPDDIESECILTGMIDQMICAGGLVVTVLPTDSQWFGITYQADKLGVKNNLSRLIALGEYPGELFR